MNGKGSRLDAFLTRIFCGGGGDAETGNRKFIPGPVCRGFSRWAECAYLRVAQGGVRDEVQRCVSSKLRDSEIRKADWLEEKGQEEGWRSWYG